MRAFLRSITRGLVCGTALSVFTATAGPLLNAEEQFSKMGEVYFRFFLNDRPITPEIANLSNTVSVAKAVGTIVYAFANREEFGAFLRFNLPYEVLTPPGLEGPAPQMSDYSTTKHPGKPGELLFDWTKYPTYTGYLNIISTLQSTYPDKVKYSKIGSSMGGRDLLMMNISTNVGKRENEPKVLLKAGIHGNETFPIMLLMRMVDWLCANYSVDPRAKRILDSIDLWVSPMHNPDATYKGGDNTVQGAIRYNNNGKDLNRNYPPLPPNKNPDVFEKEVAAYMAFEKQHTFVVEIGYHSGTEGIPYPWSAVSRAHPDKTWYEYASRKYADTCQKNGPSGFFDDINNGAGQGYQCLYPAVGTEKDYLPYIAHCRGNCVESSSDYILPESKLESYWNYHYRSLLNWIQEASNGIRGNVTDSVSGKGLKAKIWIEKHDVESDSSFMYSDTPHGNYTRPIAAGTWDATYSCPGCKSKTVKGITVQNSKAAFVNVKLDCGTGAAPAAGQRAKKASVSATSRGISIDCGAIKGVRRIGIYDIRGRLVRMIPMEKGALIEWNPAVSNAQKLGNGCYVVFVESAGGDIAQPVTIPR